MSALSFTGLRLALGCMIGLHLMASGVQAEEHELGEPFMIPAADAAEEWHPGLGVEAPSALAFDSRNRPYMFNSHRPESFGIIWTLRDGEWVGLSYREALATALPDLAPPGRTFSHSLGTLAFDAQDGLYAIVTVPHRSKYEQAPWQSRTRSALLYSPDLGRTWQAIAMPDGAEEVFLELPMHGWGALEAPPAIGVVAPYRRHSAPWADYYRYSVVLPRVHEGQLRLSEPILLTDRSFGISNHSGGYSFAVTRDGRTHVVYAEIEDQSGVPWLERGNPTWIATVDRGEERVVSRRFLVKSFPKEPDAHATPVVTMDRRGRLHVLAGSHGGGRHLPGPPFLYLRSLEPNRIDGGWTDAEPVGHSQTYATLICDADDTLHTIFRSHATWILAYQRKPVADRSWSDMALFAQRPPGRQGYCNYHHRLFRDRSNAIYASFTYRDQSGANNDLPRMLVVTTDGGRVWRRATRSSLAERVR